MYIKIDIYIKYHDGPKCVGPLDRTYPVWQITSPDLPHTHCTKPLIHTEIFRTYAHQHISTHTPHIIVLLLRDNPPPLRRTRDDLCQFVDYMIVLFFFTISKFHLFGPMLAYLVCRCMFVFGVLLCVCRILDVPSP